jgi:hypothetical protein
VHASRTGDAGAHIFIHMLSKAKHMRKFRITARGISKMVGGTIGEILKSNNPPKKKVAKAKK